MADLTDEELRAEFTKFGVKMGPITPTTRAVYMRKLQRLREAKTGGETVSNSKRSLQGFSSDESDSENSNHINHSRNLRQRRSDINVRNVVTRRTGSPGRMVAPNNPPSNAPSNAIKHTPPPLTRRQRALADGANKSHHPNKSEYSDYDTDEDSRFQPSRHSNGGLSITVKSSPEEQRLHPRTSTPAKNDHSYHQGDSLIKRHFPVTSVRNNYVDSQFRTTDSFPTTTNKSQWISMLLVGFTVLFFIGLGVIYLGLLQNEVADNSTLPSTAYSTLQNINASADRRSKIVGMSNSILTILQDQAGQHECSLDNNPPRRNMTLKQLQSKLINEKSSDMRYWPEALSLLLHNPKMGVWLMDKFGEHVHTSDLDRVELLEAERAWKPLWCRLYQAIRKVFYQIVLVISVITLIGACIAVFAWTWMQRKEEREKVLFMVQRILDVLENHESACKEDPVMKPYLAIPHVRDMLIPLAERGSMQKIWDKAVKFLEDNESRVRTECQEVEGENYEVWRWLPKNTEVGKMKSRWQGEAFSHSSQGGMNSLTHGPSSCLKIRNMFDQDDVLGDKWKDSIEDALMEKCKDLKAILHIKIDETSNEGCVYLKCKNPEAALQVYTKLHGTWYSGKLVTVKYIRDERYQQRFPDAMNVSKSL